MSNESFGAIYSVALRIARIHARQAVQRGSTAPADQDDYTQEALIACWKASSRYDSDRSSSRTFIEHVVRNRVASMASSSRRHRCLRPLEMAGAAETRFESRLALRLDIATVLRCLEHREQVLAGLLAESTVSQISRAQSIARATLYRSIKRLRTALTDAGLGNDKSTRRRAGGKV